MTRRLSLLATAAACLLATAAHAQPMFFGGYGAQGSGGGVLASVNADGWSAIPVAPATYAPDSSPVTVPVTRQGYDGSGNLAPWVDTITLTQRVRTPCSANPCPGAATLDSSGRTALSGWVCVGDTGPFTNNTALACPTDVAAFISTDHQVIGNSLTVEFIAASVFAHSQGAPIPYAVCTATDGTHTVTQAATYIPSFIDNQVLPDDAYDLSKLSGYRATFNTTTMTNLTAVTANCVAFPYDGGAAAKLDSSTSPTRGWSPQVYYKNTSPPTPLYVANTTATPAGSDSTGTGTSLLPYATVQKALNVAGASGRDGLVINIKEDTSGSGATFAYGAGTVTAAGATNGEVIVQADPAATGTITLTLPASNVSMNSKWVRIRKLSMTRTGLNFFIAGPTTGRMVLEGVTYNNASEALKLSTNPIALIGGSTSNYSQVWQAASGYSVFPVRGHTINAGVGASNTNLDGYILAANSFVGITPSQVQASFNYNGIIFANNIDNGLGNNGTFFGIGLGSTAGSISGIALINNSSEATGTLVTGGGLSRDPPEGSSLSNVIVWNNTAAGGFASGRWNLFYDNNNSVQGVGACGATNYCTIRTHTFLSVVGNFLSEANTKSDLFVSQDGAAGPDPTDGPFHVGNWAFEYGVGARDNVYAYADANGGHANYSTASFPVSNTFSQMYGGLNLSFGTATVKRTDLWTAPQSVTYNGSTYTAGTGNGTYTLCTGVAGNCTGVSPAYQHFKGPTLLSYTLGGAARSASNDNAGAY